jgi:hypothetical protein
MAGNRDQQAQGGHRVPPHRRVATGTSNHTPRTQCAASKRLTEHIYKLLTTTTLLLLVPVLGQRCSMEPLTAQRVLTKVSPARVRALVEAALDESGWPWSRRLSLLLDELVIREEAERCRL